MLVHHDGVSQVWMVTGSLCAIYSLHHVSLTDLVELVLVHVHCPL